MGNPTIIRYPLDPSGKNPNNLVVGETHTLPNRKVRAIALRYGAFYAESVKIKDLTTNKDLSNRQYVFDQLYELPTTEYGKEVYALILLTDQSVSNDVSVTYQVVGGPYSASVEAIIAQIETLNLDNRPVAWPNIINKPVEFNPAHHLHDIGDTYGWEYVVHALNRIRDALMMGDSSSHDAILRYVDNTRDTLTNGLNNNGKVVSDHLVDFLNPHRVTAEQTGAYTKAAVDAMLAARDNSIQNLFLHANDKNNPHGTTAAQVGAYTKEEVASLLGNTNTTLTAALKAHLDDKLNPHNVTATQLNVYVKPEIDSKLSGVSTELTNHVDNKNNPHNVTAAQVGLGNVQNFPMATIMEGLSERTDRYLSPANLASGLKNHVHDDRYVLKVPGFDGSIITDSTGYTYVWQGGAWRILRSPTLNWDNLENLVMSIIYRHFRFEY